MKIKLGQLIREARINMGIGQKELAKSLKKTASTLSQVETGQLIPGEHLLKSICQILNLDYELAGRVAQLEKARSEFQRVAALESLNRYEQGHARNFEAGSVKRAKLPSDSPDDSSPAREQDESGSDKKADFVIIPTINEVSLEDQIDQDGLAFSREWLSHKGGESYKKLIIAPGKDMAPLIDQGDMILIDSSPVGRQIKAGRVYALHDGHNFLLRRIYYGPSPNTIILAAENKNEYPDQEIQLKYASNHPVIFGRVFWLGRSLD